jgi:sugar phosphate isomerase/epimerase
MKPKVSLLSSFSAIGLSEAATVIATNDVKYVELYAFMQQDLDALWPRGGSHSTNALHRMAGDHDNQSVINHVAQEVYRLLGNAQVVAIATFLPEIASHGNGMSSTATKAVSFLLRLIGALNQLGHPVNVIELVGGSVVDGLWRGRTKSGVETYVVNRMNSDACLQRLFAGIRTVSEFIVENGLSTRIALELEPGPLFNFSGREALLRFCQMINSDVATSSTVGFNLDLPHWCFLAGIDLAWLRTQSSILDRIAHAHVSDHSSGHFSDAEPYLFHGASDIGPWLRFLGTLPSLKTKKPAIPYSGYISCELECCDSEHRVKRALDSTKELIERYCQ